MKKGSDGRLGSTNLGPFWLSSLLEASCPIVDLHHSACASLTSSSPQF
jgi:hypothetical protein